MRTSKMSPEHLLLYQRFNALDHVSTNIAEVYKAIPLHHLGQSFVPHVSHDDEIQRVPFLHYNTSFNIPIGVCTLV